MELHFLLYFVMANCSLFSSTIIELTSVLIDSIEESTSKVTQVQKTCYAKNGKNIYTTVVMLLLLTFLGGTKV